MIKSLSIIFPVYNEELRLKSSFNHIRSFLKKKKKFKTEIIFSDDGSQDNSYNLIVQFIKSFKSNKKIKIKVVKLKKNLGKGGALKMGVKFAKNSWILTSDIDMSVSLFQLTNWLDKKLVNKKNFIYFGSRKHEKSIVKKKIFRNILGNIMGFLISTLLNIKIKDTQCGYKLYEKKIGKLIFSKLKTFDFNHDLEIILFLKTKNIKIKELPVRWTHKNNSSLNIFWDPIKMFLGIFKIRLRYF